MGAADNFSSARRWALRGGIAGAIVSLVIWSTFTRFGGAGPEASELSSLLMMVVGFPTSFPLVAAAISTAPSRLSAGVLAVLVHLLIPINWSVLGFAIGLGVAKFRSRSSQQRGSASS